MDIQECLNLLSLKLNQLNSKNNSLMKILAIVDLFTTIFLTSVTYITKIKINL